MARRRSRATRRPSKKRSSKRPRSKLRVTSATKLVARRPARPTVYVYGATGFGHDSDEHLLDIASLEALKRLLAARRCKTWGSYAHLCGLTWKAMLDDWDSEISELTGDDNPRARAPFDFGAVHGLYYVGDLVKDPRAVAYRELIGLVSRKDPRVAALNWGGSSPAGNIDVVRTPSDEAVTGLATALWEAGHRHILFRRDDQLMREIYFENYC